MSIAALIAELLDLASAGPPDAAAITAYLGSRSVNVALRDDPRGWGAYAEISADGCPLAELVNVIGSTNPLPRNPGDFQSGPKVAAYVPRGGKTVRVFVELDRNDATVARHVTMHFQT